MFTMPELTIKQDYDEKVRQAAEANGIKKSKQAEGQQPSILARLLNLMKGPQRHLASKSPFSENPINH